MFIHAIHSEHRPVKNDRMTTVWPDDCLRRTHHSQHQKSLNLNILYINYIIIYIYCIIVNVTQLLNNRNVSRHWQYSHRVTQRRERSDNKNLAELCNIVLKMKKKYFPTAKWHYSSAAKKTSHDLQNGDVLHSHSCMERDCSAVLLNRMRKTVEEILHRQQAGFRPNRSRCEQIFTLPYVK